jgi:hypothetical protein
VNLRTIWLLTVLILAACRAPVRVGDRYHHPTAPVTYTVLGVSNGVLYSVRHEGWPVDKYETGRVSRAVFVNSLKP